jgi:hypothetical protein
MAANTKKSLALDANLLLDLAEGNDFAHDFREEFCNRGYSLLVPPTVLAELEVLVISGRSPQCHFANNALEELAAWDCQPFALSATKLAIAHHFAERLLGLRLIPETGSRIKLIPIVPPPAPLVVGVAWVPSRLTSAAERFLRVTRDSAKGN